MSEFNFKEALIVEIQKQYPQLKLMGEFLFNECKFQKDKKLFLKTQFNFPRSRFDNYCSSEEGKLSNNDKVTIRKFSTYITQYNISSFYIIEHDNSYWEITFFNDLISVNHLYEKLNTCQN